MNSPPPEKSPASAILCLLDRSVIALVQLLVVLTKLRSRDPRERFANLLRGDPQDEVRIRGWEAVLHWSPKQRVGCCAGVVIGIAVGGAILWYGIR